GFGSELVVGPGSDTVLTQRRRDPADRPGVTRDWHADVAQLVEHHLAKVRVAGSNPVVRSEARLCGRLAAGQPRSCGGVAEWLRQGPAKPCTRVRFPSPPPGNLRLVSCGSWLSRPFTQVDHPRHHRLDQENSSPVPQAGSSASDLCTRLSG